MSTTRYIKEQPNGEIQVTEFTENLKGEKTKELKIKKEDWKNDIKEIINKKQADKKAKKYE